MCTKFRHPTRAAAAKAIQAIRSKPSFIGRLAIYPCTDCGGWHLTSHRVSRKWRGFQPSSKVDAPGTPGA